MKVFYLVLIRRINLFFPAIADRIAPMNNTLFKRNCFIGNSPDAVSRLPTYSVLRCRRKTGSCYLTSNLARVFVIHAPRTRPKVTMKILDSAIKDAVSQAIGTRVSITATAPFRSVD